MRQSCTCIALGPPGDGQSIHLISSCYILSFIISVYCTLYVFVIEWRINKQTNKQTNLPYVHRSTQIVFIDSSLLEWRGCGSGMGTGWGWGRAHPFETSPPGCLERVG